MQKLRLLKLVILVLLGASSGFAQINSGSPKVPFGSQTKYNFGIMPTNLPTSGTYGRSQAAADQYNYWVTQFVEKCGDGSYRVKFDNPAQTVSEGIAYGMLLSVYAGDKTHFDGFWAFFKKSMNENGLMNWMTDGCQGNARDNAATDADLDAAHALLIASEQWPSGSYLTDAKTLIANIYKSEISHQSFLTLSGDKWGSDACLNPSYQSPGYYRQYKIYDAANASSWESAVTAAESLLKKNAHATTGLASNWCDKNGTANACGPNNPYLGYGSDACRTPWRLATDVLWHGPTVASTSFDLSKKMSNWLAGYESNLRGQMSQSAANPSLGAYTNGSYTTFALSPMAMGAAYQESLNKCYSFTAGMSRDGAYFNETVRCLTLFVLTGNFWKPGSSGIVLPPEVLSAVTNEDGSKITVTFTKNINTANLGSASNFVVSVNGTAANNAVQGIAASGTSAVELTIQDGVCVAGKAITISYNGTTIKSSDNATLAKFSAQYVKNQLKGNSTLIDNCDDGNATNLIGGVWFTFNDADNKGQSTVTPLSTKDEPLQMLGVGAEGSAKSAKMEFNLSKGGNLYDPFVGLATSLAGADLTGTTGMSFWYKGAAFRIKIITTWPFAGLEDYGFFGVDVPAASNWTYFSKEWTTFTAPTWGKRAARDIKTDLNAIEEFQWQVEGPAATLNAGDKFLMIDFIECNGLVPTKLISFNVEEASDDIKTATETAANVDVVLYTNPDKSGTQFKDTTLHLTYTPTGATYKEVVWKSANPAVAAIKFNGEVTAISSGTVKMTATAVVDNALVATCEVKVVGKEILPTKVTITDAVTELDVDATVKLGTIIVPANADDKSITWTSSDPLIASVDISGVVTGRGDGTVTITATSQADNTVKSTVSIKVNAQAVLVTNIVIESTKSLYVGESFTFSPVVTPATATNNELTWTTSDNLIATVSPAGKVTALSDGLAVITATAKDGSAVYATCSITVSTEIILADKITLNKSTLTLDAGTTSTLVATVSPEGTVSNKNVVWSSADDAIASVSASGVVTAVAKGDVIITATAADGSGINKTCLVTVKAVSTVDLVTSISIQGGDVTLARLATKSLIATVLPATAEQSLTWTSSDATIVSVGATGEITALKAGVAIITASATDASGKKTTINVTVTPILVSSIVTDATRTILLDGKTIITATVLPATADNGAVTWSTSNPAIVSVNATTGEITGVALGTATITATAVDASGISSSTTVTVSNDSKPVVSVSLDQTKLSLTSGQTATLVKTVMPSNATNSDIIWQSSNINVATVDQSGNIKAIGAGTAIIKIVSLDNTSLSAVCTVTVTDINASSVTVVAPKVSLIVGGLAVIEASIAPKTATNQTLTYSTSDANVATVSSTGVITAMGTGDATITVTVTAADGSFKATSVAVSVTAPGGATVLVKTIELDKTVETVKVGAQTTITIRYTTPSDATNSAIVWTSSDNTIATVVNGVVTGEKIGTVSILASSADAGNAVASATVTVVTNATLVSSITSTVTGLSLIVGASETVTATIAPSNVTNPALIWTSSDESIATVNNGLITAKKAGQVLITASATDGSGKALQIPVNVSASGSTILASSINISAIAPLTIGASATLTTTVYPGTASQSVTYISSNEATVSVSSSGLVTAVEAGVATITAIANDGSGKKYSIEVKVNAPVVVPSSISVNVEKKTLEIGEITFYTAAVFPSNANDRTYEVTSSITGIVEIVKENNAIKAIGQGTVVLTFKANGNSTITEKITITVSAPAPINKDALNAAINTAISLAKIYANNSNELVGNTLFKLDVAFQDAKAIKLSKTSTQAEVDASTQALLLAINKLNDMVIKTDAPLDEIIVASVYPVPATEVITVEGGKIIRSVSVTSVLGFSTVLASDVNATSVQLNVADLAPANYSLIVIYTDGTATTLKLSVQ